MIQWASYAWVCSDLTLGYDQITAYVKLEWLRQRTGKNHFAMKAKIYPAAQKAAYLELEKLSAP